MQDKADLKVEESLPLSSIFKLALSCIKSSPFLFDGYFSNLAFRIYIDLVKVKYPSFMLLLSQWCCFRK